MVAAQVGGVQSVAAWGNKGVLSHLGWYIEYCWASAYPTCRGKETVQSKQYDIESWFNVVVTGQSSHALGGDGVHGPCNSNRDTAAETRPATSPPAALPTSYLTLHSRPG